MTDNKDGIHHSEISLERKKEPENEKETQKRNVQTENKEKSDSVEQIEYHDIPTKEKEMEDLVNHFTKEALDADDEMFNILLEKLKNELIKVACECPIQDEKIQSEKFMTLNAVPLEKTDLKEDLEEFNNSFLKKECVTKGDLEKELSELKALFDRGFCACNPKSETNIKDFHNTEIKYEDNSIMKKNSKALLIRSKEELEALNSQITTNKNKKKEHETNKDFNYIDFLSIKDELKSSNDQTSMENKNSSFYFSDIFGIKNKNKNEVPKPNIPLHDFINLANELKEVLHESICKCGPDRCIFGESKKEEGIQTIPSSMYETILPNETESFATANDVITFVLPPEELSLLQRVAQDPLKLSDFFIKQPTSTKYPFDLPPAASLFSTQSSICPKEFRKEEKGVNTCMCCDDQIVQTFEDIKVSYGITCAEEVNNNERCPVKISTVRIKRKRFKEVDKIKIRISLDEADEDTANVKTGSVKTPTSNSLSLVGKSSLTKYNLKSDTKTDLDESEISQGGDQLKIFIPIGSEETESSTNLEAEQIRNEK